MADCKAEHGVDVTEAAQTEASIEASRLERQKKGTFFSVRESLRSMEAIRAYDKYVKEHRIRLAQLEALVRGSMSPSEAWYEKG